jgi:hypothetical protein
MLATLEDRLVPTATIVEFPAAGFNEMITTGQHTPAAFAQQTGGGQIGLETDQGGYSYLQTTPYGAQPYGITLDGRPYLGPSPDLWVTEFGPNGQHYVARYGQDTAAFAVSGSSERRLAGMVKKNLSLFAGRCRARGRNGHFSYRAKFDFCPFREGTEA